MKIHFGHRTGKYNPLYELHRDFCAGIGPLQLGVVLVFNFFRIEYILVFRKIYLKNSIYKHNAELQRADPGTKGTGYSVLGVVFSHTMSKMDFHYSHRFS